MSIKKTFFVSEDAFPSFRSISRVSEKKEVKIFKFLNN